MTGLLNRHRTRWLLIAVLLVAVLIPVLAHQQGARAASGTILILDSSVTGGTGSVEAVQATNSGFAVEVADATQWAAKTTADFASYAAIVLGDRTCAYSPETQMAGALATIDV